MRISLLVTCCTSGCIGPDGMGTGVVAAPVYALCGRDELPLKE